MTQLPNYVIEDWKDSLDSGNIVGTIAVDLSKAFDSLPHGLLVAKLFAYGVALPACKLLCSYIIATNVLRYVMPKAIGWVLKRVSHRDQYLGPFYSSYL